MIDNFLPIPEAEYLHLYRMLACVQFGAGFEQQIELFDEALRRESQNPTLFAPDEPSHDVRF